MRKVKIHIFLVVISTIISGKLLAQDIHFSQFPQSTTNLGAIEAGNMPADIRISSIFRNQWASVTTPYKTFNIGIDSKLSLFSENLKSISAGLLINQDKAGDGEFKTLQIGLALSKEFLLDIDSIYRFRIGITGSFYQKSFDINKLNFDNQFNGDVFIPGSLNGESINNNSIRFGDIGLSLGMGIHNSNSIWNFGFNIGHLNRANQTFYSGSEIEQLMLWQINTMLVRKLNENIYLLPSLLLSKQGKARELILGTELKFILSDEITKRLAVGGGLFFRKNDAIVPLVALYINKFRFGVSYDINTSSLKRASNNRGGPEFSVVYQSLKIRANTQKKVVCPIY